MDFCEYHLYFFTDNLIRYSLRGMRVRSLVLLKDGLCLEVMTGKRNKMAAIAFALNGINGHR